MNKKHLILIIILLIVGYLVYVNMEVIKTEKAYKEFLNNYESKIVRLYNQSSLAYFNAANSGKEEDYEKSAKIDIEMQDFFMNKDMFQQLKDFKESGNIKDPLLKRQLDIQYNYFLLSMSNKEISDEIVNLQNNIEQKFNTYRVIHQGKKISDNEVDNILKNSKNSQELQDVWKQSKAVGSLVSEDIIKLVKLRNQLAQDLGFDNYHQMSLSLDEQDPQEIEAIFNKLDEEIKYIYKEAKSNIDEALSENYNIHESELMPWHYQNKFYQEVPRVFNVDMDSFYLDKDIIEICKKYYQGIGISIDDIIEKSDLYGREGKYQHAMALMMDRDGDSRVVSSIESNNYWMGTMLHEFAHAIYFQNVDKNLPWELRVYAHTLTTEAVSLLFEDMVYSPDWIKDNNILTEVEVENHQESIREYNRLSQLVFSQWSQVMYRFEKALYEDPDQDLNSLWWDLVEKYQLIKRPENRDMPDWASKIHIANSPAYYHNYLLGRLYAAQLNHYMAGEIIKTEKTDPSYANKKEIGEFLIKEVFNPGALYNWKELIKRSTKEDLNPRYFSKTVQK